MTPRDEDQPLTVGEFQRLMEHRDRITKNGETWRRYFARLTTPQNVLLAALTIFTIGGRARQVEIDLGEALERTANSQQVEAQLAREIAVITSTLARLEAQPRVDAEELAALRDRIARTVERDEFERTIRQEIIPRLERIEARVDGGRGGGS